jgi:hypothetical protein
MRYGVKSSYRVKISDRFTALKNSGTKVDINRAWGAIRENIIISAKERICYYELNISQGLMKDAQNYYIKQNKEKIAVVTGSK